MKNVSKGMLSIDILCISSNSLSTLLSNRTDIEVRKAYL